MMYNKDWDIDLQMFADGGDVAGQSDAQIGDGIKNADEGGNDANNSGMENKTFTQAEVDAIIADRLKREREKYKDYGELKKAAEELQKIKESQMSEAEKLQAKLAEYERTVADKELELASIKAEATKQKILSDMGLPLSWASRIFGTTEDEIRADAEELKQLLGAQGRPIGSGTNPPNGGTPVFTLEQVKRMSPEEINQNWEAISKMMAEGKLK
jgi:hypothetical protein